MCRRITCSKCGRPSYAGCGAHIEEVLADVPNSERCRCREERAAAGRASERKSTLASWIGSLLGKS